MPGPSMLKRRQTSIAAVVIALIVGAVSLLLAVAGAVGYRYYDARQYAAFHSTRVLGADQLALSLAPAAWNLEYPQVSRLMESHLQDPLVRAVVVQLDTRRFALVQDERHGIQTDDAAFDPQGLDGQEREIVYGNQTVGKVQVYSSAERVEAELRRALIFMVAVILVLDGALSLTLFLALRRLVLTPLHQVERYAEAITHGRQPQVDLKHLLFLGELERLKGSMDAMVQQLESRNAALRHSTERFAQAIRLFPVPVVLFEPGGQATFVNDRFVETFGYPLDEVSAIDTWYQRAYPDPVYRQQVIASWNQRVDAARRDGGPIPPETHRVTCRDGTVRSVDIGGMLTNGFNIAVLQDVTDRIRADAELSQYREHLEELVMSRTAELEATYRRLQETQFAMDHAGIAIQWVDVTSRRILYVNDHACALYGYGRQQLLASVIGAIIPDLDPHGLDQLLDRLRAEGHARVEARVRRPDGREIPLEVSCYYQPRKQEQGGHLIAFAMDITQRKAAEQALIEAKLAAEAAARARSEFLANMSHEIRTPMNAIIGMSQLALQTDLNRKQRNFIEKANLSAVSLLGILNDILDFSKVEAGHLDVEHVEFSLTGVLDNLCNVIGLKAAEKDLEFLIDIAPDTPLGLVGDPLRLGQVLLNLAGNAVKFTERGTVVVRCCSVPADGDGVILDFAVGDTGIGIGSAQMANLFNPFSQGDSSISRRFGGTGLGLAICKRLTELMGGRISAVSRPGAGSTFRFALPVGLARNQPEALPGLPEALRSLRVLVVDDNADARSILAGILGSFGLQADTLASATEARVRLEQDRSSWDLLLCDWKMPEVDGLDLVRGLHRVPGPTRPPVVMMAAIPSLEELRRAAGDLDLAGVLGKPFRRATVLESILNAFGHGTEATTEVVPTSTEGSLRGCRILLVEDNLINQELAVELLRCAGADVTVADHGQEALEFLEDKEFDCVLMDVQMPVMDGLEATRAIRARPCFAQLPIIAMTAGAMPEEKAETLAAGMNDHVVKPIDPASLFATIGRWVAGAAPPPSGAPGGGRLAPVPVGPVAGRFPGIDLIAGLDLVNRDEKRYRRILELYRNKSGETRERMAAASNTHDFAALGGLAHGLKGSAGTLGMGGVEAAARQIEAACRQQDASRLPELLATLERELAVANGSISAYLEADQGSPPAAPTGPPIDVATLVDTLDRLQRLVAANDTEAIDSLDRILEAPLPAGVRPRLGEVAHLLSRYDFDACYDHLVAAIALLKQDRP